MSYSQPFLEKIVTVTVDRPLGSRRPDHDFEYLINCGHIEGTTTPDGEELDAYILGVDHPTKSFTGKCVAIIHRTDDDDDKLIVAPPNTNYTDEEIRKYTHFQEQRFKSEIIRK